MQQFSSLLDINYPFWRFSVFAAVLYDTFRYLDYFKIRLNVWFYYLFATDSCCRFLFRLILNRKLFGIFEFSLAPLRKRPIFLLFVFSLFLLFWFFRREQKQKRKIQIFAVFAWKRTFLSQIKCWLSVFYRYMGQITPHTPVFGTRRVGQISSENFFIFLFLFFVKYYDFANSAFLPNFEKFWEHHIYFSFCIKFHIIYFCLFLWLLWRFM